MYRLIVRHSREENRRYRGGAGRILFGVVAAALLFFATPSWAADWLAPAADQSVAAPWVKDLTAQLQQEPYRDVFMNALGNSPQSLIVRYLNNAAQALQAGNKPLAQSYVDRTIEIFDNGVRRGYYSRGDVEPIAKLIRARADAAIKGEAVVKATMADDRWTGYTHKQPLGLTDEVSRISGMPSEREKAAEMKN
jgi:hypothetical protein